MAAYGWHDVTLPDGRVIRVLRAPTFAEVKAQVRDSFGEIKEALKINPPR